MIHRFHLEERFADDIYSRDRTFDVRKANHNFQRGDTIVYEDVYDGDGERLDHHPIYDVSYEVTSLLYGFGVSPGHVAISIKERR